MADVYSEGDNGVDRRAFLKRMGLIGAFAVPAIATISMTNIGDAFGKPATTSPNKRGTFGNQGGFGNQGRRHDDDDCDERGRYGNQGSYGNQGRRHDDDDCDDDDHERGRYGNQGSYGNQTHGRF